MNIKKMAYTILASGVMALCASPAQASLMLTLDSGNGNVVQVEDNGVGDLDSTVGSVLYYTSLGTWAGSVSVGYSNAPGVDGYAYLDLDSTLRSRGSGTMTITLTDNGYTTPNGLSTATTTASGLSLGTTPSGFNSSTNFTSYVSNTNVSSLGTFGTGIFGGTTGTNVDTTGGFTLTQVATITHQGAGITNFDLMTSVPEPTTLGLLGLGLLGLGFVKRRRNA